MKILFVASYNSGHFAPFILEQAKSIGQIGHTVEFFGIQGKGVMGYLRNLKALKRKITEFVPDIIHAHYGLSGLLCNLQRSVPVVTTYHGSDINDKRVRPFSRIAMKLSASNVFVSEKTMSIIHPGKNSSLIPCGVDTELFMPTNAEARPHDILFAGAFDNKTKNAPLAHEAVNLLRDKYPDIKLCELKGYSRSEVANLMNQSAALLMTSLNEGSPQVVKEAMACNLPVVSVNVGDVEQRLSGVGNCFVTAYNPAELAKSLDSIIQSGIRANGREKIEKDGLSLGQTATKIEKVYENAAQSRHK